MIKNQVKKLVCVGILLVIILTGCLPSEKEVKEIRLKGLDDFKGKAMEIHFLYPETKYSEPIDIFYYPKEEKVYAKKNNVRSIVDGKRQQRYSKIAGVVEYKWEEDTSDILLLSAVEDLNISKNELKTSEGTLRYTSEDKDLDVFEKAIVSGYGFSPDLSEIEEVKIEYSKDFEISSIEVEYLEDEIEKTYVEEYEYNVSLSDFKKGYKREEKELQKRKKESIDRSKELIEGVKEKELKGEVFFKGNIFAFRDGSLDVSKLPYTPASLTKQEIETNILDPMSTYSMNGVWQAYSYSRENQKSLEEVQEFMESKIPNIVRLEDITIYPKDGAYYLILTSLSSDIEGITAVYKFE